MHKMREILYSHNHSVIKNIEITCIGTDTLPLSELIPYNARLKDRREKDIASLARKIITKGFSFPIFVWRHPETHQNLILDGNGRYLALQWLEKQKYKIPTAIPVISIYAVDEIQARKKVLELNNLNGKISEDAFLTFAKGLQIDLSDYTIPCLDISLLQSIQSERIGFFPPDTPDQLEMSTKVDKPQKAEKPAKTIPTVGGTGNQQTQATCPHCGTIHEIIY